LFAWKLIRITQGKLQMQPGFRAMFKGRAVTILAAVVAELSGCSAGPTPKSQSPSPFPPRRSQRCDIEIRRAYNQGYRTRWVATTMPRREMDWEREPHPGYSKDEKEAWRRGALAADLSRLNEWIRQNQGELK
jgi:hypothetical protein